MMPETRPNAWYGYRRDTRDPRDRMFAPRPPHLLPAKVDLRNHCPPVMDQGDLGSCTAHGITGALRFLRIKAGKPDVELSRLQLYFDERTIEHTVGEDAGAEIRDGIKCAAKIGVGHENLWPYKIAKFRAKPPAAVYADAVQFNALDYSRVEVSVAALKAALAGGDPVVIGVTLFESFESDAVAANGMVPMPDLKREKLVGGHCMYAVGYGQHAGTFTVRNSWAADWGDRGDCYFPEAYLGSTKFGGDYWVVRGIG
jgi:C1A family cysteine protease